jgi:SAM-dependent methyltransferase
VSELPCTTVRAEEEILDRDDLDAATVERALAELRRVNLLLLGHLPAQRTLLPRLAAGPPRQLLLDVGTGSGEVAARLAARAAAVGRQVRVVGVDRKLSHLRVRGGWRRGHLAVVADARALPFRHGAVDWSLSTLFFHHFDAGTNRLILSEMRRVASRGAAVIDLRRSRWGPRLAALAIPLTGAGPITRHDGRVSLARAWPLEEVAALVAGLPVEELRRRFPFRFSLVLAPRHPG